MLRKRIFNGKWLCQLVFLSVALVVSSLSLSATKPKAMLWELTHGNSTLYLLGSVHVWKKDLYPLHKSIDEAYNRADVLTVEVNLNNLRQQEVQNVIRKEGIYPPGISIIDYLSIEQTRELERKLRSKGFSLAAFQQYKPWLLSTQVSQANLAQLGYHPDQGIDQHYLRRAKGKKPVRQLETFTEQISIIAEVYDDFLKTNPELLIEEKSLDRDYLEELMLTWKNGRYERLYSLLVDESISEHPQAKKGFDKLIDQRNKKFVSKIITKLGDGKTHFVVIGAGHFGGPNGIIPLLEQQGYQLRQVDTNQL